MENNYMFNRHDYINLLRIMIMKKQYGFYRLCPKYTKKQVKFGWNFCSHSLCAFCNILGQPVTKNQHLEMVKDVGRSKTHKMNPTGTF